MAILKKQKKGVKKITKYAYKNKIGSTNNVKPFERMTDEELIKLYYKVKNIQYGKNMNIFIQLNEYLLKSGKIEMIR